MRPNEDTTKDRGITSNPVQKAERGLVTSTGSVDPNTEPSIRIKPTNGPPTTAQLALDASGDTRLPAVGDIVYFTRMRDNTSLVLGFEAVDHGGYTTQRRIDHRHSDAAVTFEEDGSVTVESDGTTVTVEDGSVSVDGGSTPVVTGVETTTDSDGRVTDVTPVTDDSIQL